MDFAENRWSGLKLMHVKVRAGHGGAKCDKLPQATFARGGTPKLDADKAVIRSINRNGSETHETV
jgi:hypothetical protein